MAEAERTREEAAAAAMKAEKERGDEARTRLEGKLKRERVRCAQEMEQSTQKRLALGKEMAEKLQTLMAGMEGVRNEIAAAVRAEKKKGDEKRHRLEESWQRKRAALSLLREGWAHQRAAWTKKLQEN